MPFTLADSFKQPVFQQLNALREILIKAQAYAAEIETDEEALLELRLFPNMWPLHTQVQFVCEFSARAAARLTDEALPEFPYEKRPFSELLEKVDWALEAVKGTDDEALNASVERIIEMPIGPDDTLRLSGQDYLRKFFLPNFYFHITTTYNLLRQGGMPLGKRDYIGQF